VVTTDTSSGTKGNIVAALAVIYDRERQKGNGNRATLAVARKMVAYLLAVDRQRRDFVSAEERRTAAA
jgi:transposase